MGVGGWSWFMPLPSGPCLCRMWVLPLNCLCDQVFDELPKPIAGSHINQKQIPVSVGNVSCIDLPLG